MIYHLRSQHSKLTDALESTRERRKELDDTIALQVLEECSGKRYTAKKKEILINQALRENEGRSKLLKEERFLYMQIRQIERDIEYLTNRLSIYMAAIRDNVDITSSPFIVSLESIIGGDRNE